MNKGTDTPSATPIPAPLSEAEPVIEFEALGARLTKSEIADPYLFADTDRAASLVAGICKNLYFSAYERSYGDRFEKSYLRGLAEKILDAKRNASSAEQEAVATIVLHEEVHAASAWDATYYQENDIKSALQDLVSEVEDKDLGVELCVDTLIDALRENIADRLEEEDGSAPEDLFSRFDRAEVFFCFRQPGTYMVDEMVESHKNWADPEELAITDGLKHALAVMGYTVGEFRSAFRNRHESMLTPGGIRKRNNRLLTPQELKVVIENACSTNFVFGCYAYVSIDELIKLDLTKPVTFDRGVVGVWNPYNGIYHDSEKFETLTFTPKEGVLEACTGYSPDDVCGLVLSYFESSITNED